MKNNDNENILINAVDEWLKEGNIQNGKINQENLNRLNKANILALRLFNNNVKTVDFEQPKNNRSSAQTFITCEDFSIEDVKEKNKKLFKEFLNLIDEFNVSPIDAVEIAISFSIYNVYE